MPGPPLGAILPQVRTVTFLFWGSLAACTAQVSGSVPDAGASSDAGRGPDAGTGPDAGVDAGTADAGAPDAGVRDAGATDAGVRTYRTLFPLGENPISEGGMWTTGHAAGQSCGGYCWGDVQIRPDGGLASGVDEPTQYGDPTAILTGTWGDTQTASAVVHAPVPAPNGGCCMEAEVRLRFNISAGVATGYEIYCSILSSNTYCHVASWGGPNGAWVNLDGPSWDTNNPECPGFPVSGPQILREGDVLSATVSGSNPVTITGSINGTPFVTVVDQGKCHFNPPNSGPYGPWPSGAPGIGFYGSGFDTFGFTSFTASAQ